MMYENNSQTLPRGKPRRVRSRKRKFLLILFLFLVAATGGFFLFLKETEDEKAPPVVEVPDPPIVASEEIKSPPEEPGGLEIAHQDKLIYERLTPTDVTVSNEDALDEVMMGLVAEDPLADFSVSGPGEDFTEPATSPDSAVDSVEPTTASIESEEGEPEESAPEEEVDPTPEPSATPLPESDGLGDYVVQLASFARSADAEATLARMTSKFSDVVGTNTLFIKETDLGDRGIWHRLRVGYFTVHSEAAEVCAKFQSRGQDCLVTAR